MGLFNSIKRFVNDGWQADSSIKAKENRLIHSTRKAVGDGWMNILTGLGMAGDKKTSGFYNVERIIPIQELDNLYRFDGLTRTIVDVPASDMTRQGWEIQGDPEGKINAKLESIDFTSRLIKLIRWARMYGGGIIVMGIADGLPLDMPVNPTAIKGIKWLHTFDCFQSVSSNATLNRDLNSPNYAMPESYLVNDPRTAQTFIVHHSRVLRMDGSLLPSRMANWNGSGWADSLIQSIYQELRNYQTVIGNSATMTQSFVTNILKIENLAEQLSSGTCGDNQVINRANVLNLTMGTTNTAVMDTKESFEKISTNVSGIPELIDRFQVGLSAVVRMPVTTLFGRSPAGMNSTGDADIRNYYDYISQEQQIKLAPLFEKIINYILLSQDFDTAGIDLEGWGIQFNPLWQNTEREESEIRRTTAEMDAIYLDRGVLDPEEVATSRFGGSRYSMNTNIDLISRSKDDWSKRETERLEIEKIYGSQTELEQEGNGKLN